MVANPPGNVEMTGVVVREPDRLQAPSSRNAERGPTTAGEFLPDVVNLGTNSALRGRVETHLMSPAQISSFLFFFLVENFISLRIPAATLFS